MLLCSEKVVFTVREHSPLEQGRRAIFRPLKGESECPVDIQASEPRQRAGKMLIGYWSESIVH